MRRFVVTPAGEPRWRRALATLHTRGHEQRRDEEILLDSFDRRLHKAGLRLSARGEPPRVLCRLKGRHGKRSEFVLEGVPRFAWDLPWLQALELARVLEARPLEPIGVHETQGEHWAVLDEHEKTVAWIEDERHLVHSPRRLDNGKPPIRCIELRAVRGCRTAFHRLKRVLERSGGLIAAERGEFDPLRHVESVPEPGRWPRLDRRIAALPGLARIVRAQLGIFAANEAGMRAGEDAEHLHDARIALRRVRSLLGQMKSVFPASEREELAVELRWLSDCLGRARDIDTLLLELRLTDPEIRGDLAPALARLEHERALRYAEMRSALDSERHAKLRARLEAMLATRATGSGSHAAKPFVRVLSRRLRRRLDQVVAKTRRLADQHAAEDLHELRIACKKLRYLMECCRGFVPRAILARCFAGLKDLGGALGTIQDARVHCGVIVELAATLTDAGPRACFALGRFHEKTLQRARAARASYSEARKTFLSPSGQAEYAALLRALEGKRAS